MKNEVPSKTRRPLLRVALIAALFLLLFAVFTVAAFADTVEPGTYEVTSISYPKEGEPFEQTPRITKNTLVITSVRLVVDGTIHYNDGTYTPRLSDNENDSVYLELIVRPADGYQWEDGGPKLPVYSTAITQNSISK